MTFRKSNNEVSHKLITAGQALLSLNYHFISKEIDQLAHTQLLV